MPSRTRYRAFKCRLGVHRITIGALPPLPHAVTPTAVELNRLDPHADKWMIVTGCKDCSHVASWRYADGPAEK